MEGFKFSEEQGLYSSSKNKVSYIDTELGPSRTANFRI
jgi:hypothetical protein